MKMFPHLLGVAASLIFAMTATAQVPLGSIAATFALRPSKVLADPTRQRVYVADAATNSVAVIDTTTLQIIATIPTGSDPADMAISLDGSTLYVANSGSNAAAIVALDLDTLTVVSSFSLPGAATAIAAGLGGSLYTILVSDGLATSYQIDASSGVIQAANIFRSNNGSLLQVSPDGNTIFVSNINVLESYDVSAAAPVLLQTNNNFSYSPVQLVLSHDGRYLCFPCGGGDSGPDPYDTFLIDSADITSYYGALNTGPYPGPLAFSLDDMTVYQTTGSVDPQGTAIGIEVFDTQSFALLATTQYPAGALAGEVYGMPITSMAADNTGTYLFIGESVLANGGPDKTGQLVVVGTGKGTLSPPTPIITIEATVPRVEPGSGSSAAVVVTRTGSVTQKLVVHYTVKGSAVNGTDYALLNGKLKIKPGKTSATIQITPSSTVPIESTKKVKLTLSPEATYQFSDPATAKVKIVPSGG